MRFVSKVVLSMLVLLLGAVSAGWAADMCFTDIILGEEASLAVAKSFTLPTAGQCKEFNGYYAGTALQLSGNACGTSDNSRIRFSLRYSQFRVTAGPGVPAANPYVYHALAWLPRSGGIGEVEYIFDNGGPSGNFTGVFGFKKVPCPPPSARPFN